MPEIQRSLLRDRDFATWWAGQSVSLLGDSFSILALPLVAALALHADALEMGVLGAMSSVPALLFGLPAGIWLDRVRRRPVLVAAQAAQAIALATVPAAAVLGGLTLLQLYLVAFVTGTGTAFLRISQNAYLPALVGRDRLVEANSLYQTSMTAGGLAGPTLAGVAVQALGAPLAVAFDAMSFAIGRSPPGWCGGPSRRRRRSRSVMCCRRWRRDSRSCSGSRCCGRSWPRWCWRTAGVRWCRRCSRCSS